MDALKLSIAEYIEGKRWYWYVPAWLMCVYIFLCIIEINPYLPLRFVLLPVSSIMFWVHEYAHLFMGTFPELVTAASGSLSELLLGTILVLYAFKTRYYFTALYCMTWLAFACKDAGQYMADARVQQLTLVNPFGETATHDWHYVFSQLHILNHDSLIGGVIKFYGYALMMIALGWGLWLMYKMASSADESLETVQETVPSEPIHEEKDVLVTTAAEKAKKSIYPEPTRGVLADRQNDYVDK